MAPAGRALIAERRTSSIAGPLLAILIAPLAAPALLALAGLLGGLALGGEIPEPAWIALLVLGPALPLYVVLLPLAPFLVRLLRRGWAPRFRSVLTAALAAAAATDAVFYLVHRSGG